MKVKDLVLISILSSLTAVLEFALSFIPNVQTTFLLLTLFSIKLPLKHNLLLLLVYVFIDNLLMSSINPIFMLFQYLACLIVPLTYHFIKSRNINILSLTSGLCSIMYCWVLIIPAYFITKVDLRAYILADLPFEGILFFSTVLSIELLYNPLAKVFDNLLKTYYKRP